MIFSIFLVGVRRTNSHRWCESTSFHGPSQETGCFQLCLNFPLADEECKFRVERTFDFPFWKNACPLPTVVPWPTLTLRNASPSMLKALQRNTCLMCTILTRISNYDCLIYVFVYFLFLDMSVLFAYLINLVVWCLSNKKVLRLISKTISFEQNVRFSKERMSSALMLLV